MCVCAYVCVCVCVGVCVVRVCARNPVPFADSARRARLSAPHCVERPRVVSVRAQSGEDAVDAVLLGSAVEELSQLLVVWRSGVHNVRPFCDELVLRFGCVSENPSGRSGGGAA